MNRELKPFNKLDDRQKRCCIDIAIGMAIIAARIPTFGKGLFRDISDQWALSADLDENLCKYALTGVSTSLYNSTWEFHVTKENESMVCQFIKVEEPGGLNGDGDDPLQ
jgi:hypothetical protein